MPHFPLFKTSRNYKVACEHNEKLRGFVCCTPDGCTMPDCAAPYMNRWGVDELRKAQRKGVAHVWMSLMWSYVLLLRGPYTLRHAAVCDVVYRRTVNSDAARDDPSVKAYCAGMCVNL